MKALALGVLAVFSVPTVAQINQDSVNTLLSSAYSCSLPATLQVDADEQTTYQGVADQVTTTLTDVEATYNLPGLTQKLTALMADEAQVSKDAPEALDGIKQAVAQKDLVFSADYVQSLCTKMLRNASNTLELEDAAASARMPMLDLVPTVRTAPQYPKKAVNRGIEGSATYTLTVSEQGKVTNCQRTHSLASARAGVKVKPTNSNIWDKTSCKALNAFKYDPIIFNGAPVSFNTEYQMHYFMGNPPPTLTALRNKPMREYSTVMGIH